MNDRESTFEGDGHIGDAIPEHFRAQITGSVTDGSGTIWYTWSEVLASATTGAYSTMTGGRAGTYNPTGPSGINPTQECNNTVVANGTLVELRLRSAVGGSLNGFFYEFDAPGGSGGVTGSGTDQHLTRWNGTSAIQDSAAVLSGAGELSLYTANPSTGSTQVIQLVPGGTSGVATIALWPQGTGGADATVTSSYLSGLYGFGIAATIGPSSGYYEWAWNVSRATSSAPVVLDFDSGSSTGSVVLRAPQFGISGGGHDGASGTDGAGSVFSGGICTVIGSGGGGGVTSFTGDGTVLSNSASTGAVTATLASASGNVFLASPATGGSGALELRTIAPADIPQGYGLGASAGALVVGLSSGTATATSTSCTSSWANVTGGSLTLPGAGTYLLFASVMVTGVTGASVSLRLYDSTASAIAVGPVVATYVTTGLSSTTALIGVYTAAGGDTIHLQSIQDGGSGCSVTSNAYGYTTLGYVRIA